MDGSQSVFISMKETLPLVSLSRATIDRLRRAGEFPDSFELTGAARGKIGFLLSEVHAWMANRRKRILTPPPAP